MIRVAGRALEECATSARVTRRWQGRANVSRGFGTLRIELAHVPVAELPTTATGEIPRLKLRELQSSSKSSERATPADSRVD